MAAPGKSCGECGACCTLAEVRELEKAAHVTCAKYVAGQGCSIYEQRPGACRAFECGFLQNPDLGDEWRPDRAGFLLYFAPGPRLVVETDLATPDTWRAEPFLSQLREWSSRDRPTPIEVVVRSGDHLTMIFPEAEIALGPDLRRPIRSGYRDIGGGKRIPFAEFARPSAWAL
jgi:hypothetical protein